MLNWRVDLFGFGGCKYSVAMAVGSMAVEALGRCLWRDCASGYWFFFA